MRRFARLLGGTAAALFALLLPDAGMAAITCAYDAGAQTVSVAFDEPPIGAPGEVGFLQASPSGFTLTGTPWSEIRNSTCDGATPTTTDAIVVRGDVGLQELVLAGAFAPGATAELDGTSEIEIDVDLGTDWDRVVVFGDGTTSTYVAGTDGVNLNSGAESASEAPDADLTLTNVDLITLDGSDGADEISGDGGHGTGAATALPLWLRGRGGDDRLTGGDGDDKIFGQGGDDALSGGPGDDEAYGGEGPDSTLEESGADTIVVGAGSDRADGEEGGDTYDVSFGALGTPTIADTGTAGDDVVTVPDCVDVVTTATQIRRGSEVVEYSGIEGRPCVVLDAAFTIDVTSGVAPLTVNVDASSSAGAITSYSWSFGDGSTATGVTASHTYVTPATYHLTLTVGNGFAFDSQTVVVLVDAPPTPPEPPTASFTLDRSIGFSPLTVNVDASSSSGTISSYAWDFGDGGVGSGRTASHTYVAAGTYQLTLTVSNNAGSSHATRTIRVFPDEPLHADAGDDLTVVEGVETVLDGSNSRPIGIDSFSWSFGDGGTSTDAIATHTYDAPGVYTATLTVARGAETSTDTAKITVVPRTLPGLAVTVERSGGAPLPGADVVVIGSDGARHPGVTASAGVATIHGLADGEYSVYAIADGYLPGVAQATQSDGSGSAVVTLRSGEIGATTLESRRLTRDEVVALGLNPDDPANVFVYAFRVELCFSSGTAQCTEISGNSTAGGGLVGIDFPGAVCGPSSCTGTLFDQAITLAGSSGTGASGTSPDPHLFWLVVPAKASFLKEFFAVRMVVTNLAASAFTFSNGTGTLSIPDGLALAPISTRQAASFDVADIPGGASRTVAWVLRGDESGEYHLEAKYSGTLEPFGRSLLFTARTANPLKVWGGNALQMIVDADDTALESHPYRLRIGLRNVTEGDPATVYNVAVKASTGEDVLYQPKQQLAFSTAAIAPGETFWTDDYIVVAPDSGDLDLRASFVAVAGGSMAIPSTIIAHAPRERRTLNGLTTGQFSWSAVPGATKYEIFTAPPGADLGHPDAFPSSPIAETTATSITIPSGGVNAWYAVSTVIDGKNVLFHPIIQAVAPPDPPDPPDPPPPPDRVCIQKFSSFDYAARLLGIPSDLLTLSIAVNWCHDGEIARLSVPVRVSGDAPMGFIQGALENLIGLTWRYNGATVTPGPATGSDPFVVTAKAAFETCEDWTKILQWIPVGRIIMTAAWLRLPLWRRIEILRTIKQTYLFAGLVRGSQNGLTLLDFQLEGIYRIVEELFDKSMDALARGDLAICVDVGWEPTVTVTLRKTGSFGADINSPFPFEARRIFDAP